MPTRENKTSIGISNHVKDKLEAIAHAQDSIYNSWDDFFLDLIKWIESQAE